jgi:hypothetical protein
MKYKDDNYGVKNDRNEFKQNVAYGDSAATTNYSNSSHNNINPNNHNTSSSSSNNGSWTNSASRDTSVPYTVYYAQLREQELRARETRINM